MPYVKGQLVRHPSMGLGKIVNVMGDKVSVFFKDTDENPKMISTRHVGLEVCKDQRDPWLDHLDLKAASEGRIRHYLTHTQAIDKFLRVFPGGFLDARYVATERDYKWDAHGLWDGTLSQKEFERLLGASDYADIARRAIHVESKVNLLFKTEKAALHDGVKAPEAAKEFSIGLYDLIYGSAENEERFERWAKALDRLPQPQSATTSWPIQTIFPFLAQPDRQLFLKPDVTKKAAERRAFSLNYKSQPNWLTYSRVLEFGNLLFKDLTELHPRDMIDIQSLWLFN